MSDVVGIRFKRAGKVYYFDPGELELEINDLVVVETMRGLELGRMVIARTEEPANEAAKPLKAVVRKADTEDIERAQELEEKEQQAFLECARLVEKYNLPIKLLSAEYNLEGNRLTIHFGAEERVDFRELVRELAGRLKVRVEMRQTGPRDGAKLVGGCGRCGRVLCCVSFLSEFAPVSIRMAKEQNLPLNPMKISGVCGRLMCCLGYEYEQYKDMKARLPKDGNWVSTENGVAKVVGSNPLKQTVMVELESQATVELPVDQISTIGEEPTKNSKKKDNREPKEKVDK